jgi:signal transduction histidine kinase
MRTAFASILVVAALAAALLGWFGAGWSQVEEREHELRAAPRRAAEAQARVLAGEVVSRLESLRVEEARRPYYHYQNLYHDPRSASEGIAIQPSPLATGPESPLVRGHFQLHDKGGSWEVTMPTINDELPALNKQDSFAADSALRGELVAIASHISDAAAGPALSLPTLVAANDPQPTPPHGKRIKPRTIDDGTTKPKTVATVGSGSDEPRMGGSGTIVAQVEPEPQQGDEPQAQTITLSPDQYAQNQYANNAYNLAIENRRNIDPSELQQQRQQQRRPQQQRNAPPQQQQQQVTTPQAQGPQSQAANPPPQQNANPGQAQVTSPAPATETSTTTAGTASSPPRRPRRPKPKPPAPPPPVTIAIAPLEWHAMSIGGRTELVALRRVDTPDGTFTQGLILDPAGVAAYVEDRLPGAKLVSDANAVPDVAVADVPIGSWKVAVPLELGSVAASVAAVRSGFWGRFVPVSLLAALCGMLVIVVVARAERLAKARSRFAAAAAHELRTPLAGLQLYGDMLSDGLGDPSKAQQYAHRISEEASRLGRVVANVLGFSQLERGDLSVNPRDGDAAAAARDVVERVRPALERAGVTFEVDLPDELPARLDPDALSRVLGNLLDNAEKYSRDADKRVVSLTGKKVGDTVELAVTDSGPGVAAGARLFVPFSRGVGTDGPAGLGLGLALSRSLARAMGGDLSHDGGAKFVLSLPSPSARG